MISSVPVDISLGNSATSYNNVGGCVSGGSDISRRRLDTEARASRGQRGRWLGCTSACGTRNGSNSISLYRGRRCGWYGCYHSNYLCRDCRRHQSHYFGTVDCRRHRGYSPYFHVVRIWPSCYREERWTVGGIRDWSDCSRDRCHDRNGQIARAEGGGRRTTGNVGRPRAGRIVAAKEIIPVA